MAIWAKLVWAFILTLIGPARLMFALIPVYEMKLAGMAFEEGLSSVRRVLELAST